MTLGDRFKHKRKSIGLTQSELASRCGVSAKAVWEVERGRGRLATALAIMDELDFRLTRLPTARSVSEALRKMRERRGMSLEAVAAKTKLSPATVSNLERGRGNFASLIKVLAYLSPSTRERKPEISSWQGGSRDCRFTPPSIFQPLDEAVGGFDLDPCAHADSRVRTPQRYTIEDNGLAQPWCGAVFANPPFSDAPRWIEKAFGEWVAGRCHTIVALLPVRTHTKAFQRYVLGEADVLFLDGRVSFEGAGGEVRGQAPFGCLVACWSTDPTVRDRVMHALPGRIVRANSIASSAAA